MPTDDEARAALLAAARVYIDVADTSAPITVVVALGRAVVVSDGQPAAPAPDPAQLPRLQQAIYDALAGGPLPSRTLARRVKRRFNSYFRGVLSSMVKAGLILRVATGYARQEDGRTADSQPDKNE